jgi:replicative DNA helicase
LANLGVNWALAGLNVLYLTFELSENLVSMRIDSMVTGISTRDVFKNIDDVEMRVRIIGKQSGAMQVKYMPTGKTANDIRSYVKEYEIKTSRKIDVVLVDYLDLMMPVSVKVSPENLFIKDKYVSEELRNLAMELNTVFVTAAQLNRGAVEEVEFDHSHISGGLSKIQTADNVFGIFTSRAMRERGRYQLQLMKTRSSSGVNSKIDLEFDVDTLRISDTEQEEDNSTPATTGSSIVAALKRNTTAGSTPDHPDSGSSAPRVRGEVDSSRLRQFLNNLGDE